MQQIQTFVHQVLIHAQELTSAVMQRASAIAQPIIALLGEKLGPAAAYYAASMPLQVGAVVLLSAVFTHLAVNQLKGICASVQRMEGQRWGQKMKLGFKVLVRIAMIVALIAFATLVIKEAALALPPALLVGSICGGIAIRALGPYALSFCIERIKAGVAWLKKEAETKAASIVVLLAQKHQAGQLPSWGMWIVDKFMARFAT